MEKLKTIKNVNMITWNIDLTNYTEKELEKLLEVVQQMDRSIAKQIETYLVDKYNT